MSGSFHIALKAGERIYVNGAVMRFNCKVSIEFLNDVTFLLESHVMLPEQATTPLRELYFAAQTLLMEPTMAEAALRVFYDTHALICAPLRDEDLLADLQGVRALVAENRVFEALKLIRALYVADETIPDARMPQASAHAPNFEGIQ